MSLLLAPTQAHGILHVSEIQKEPTLISHFIFFIVYHVPFMLLLWQLAWYLWSILHQREGY